MSGTFVWHDLQTNDPEAAKAFYTQLLGWTISPQDMGEMGSYDMIFTGDGGGIGGIMKNPAEGVPSHWLSYLDVPGGVDAATAKITELGGAIYVPPMDIPNVGRFGVAADAQGAVFAPFQGIEGGGEVPPAPPAGAPGGVTWVELMTQDAGAAISFYGQVAGWTNQTMDMGTGPYNVQSNGSAMTAGIMQAPDPNMPSAWVIYFEITQPTMDEALAKVKELGGTVAMGPMDVPTVGTIAAVQDPTGGWFCLMKSAS